MLFEIEEKCKNIFLILHLVKNGGISKVADVSVKDRYNTCSFKFVYNLRKL